MRIGLMGFDFMSPNKGCEALTYSFINMLIDEFGEDILLKNYTYGELGILPEKYPSIRFETRRPQVKNPLDWIRMKTEMSQLDIIFDVTFGDGFSDIYGKKWNIATNIAKEIAILSNAPFVLLPQTYGPYQNRFLRKWAAHILQRSDLCYSRDIASADEMNSYCGNRIQVLTDMAFALPYDRTMYPLQQERIKIGINISSLLWDSAYAKNNRFALKTDYKLYITSLIDHLLIENQYVIYLIPHVVDPRNYESAENDVRACDAVKALYNDKSSVIVAPAFETPIEAKSFIANMDIFLGARMHSTIAAVSAGVATIPFAYSKKFKTMFGNLNYDYVIEARELDTQIALERSLDWIHDYIRIGEKAKAASLSTKEKMDMLKVDISRLAKSKVRQ